MSVEFIFFVAVALFLTALHMAWESDEARDAWQRNHPDDER